MTPARQADCGGDEPGLAPVVTIDGPSGAGKGTVATAVADRLGWRLLDSGALYRVVALMARRCDVQPAALAAAATLADDVVFAAGRVLVDGVDETPAIRDEAVGDATSVMAAIPAVRAALLATQRRFRQPPGLVADGRDMGTVVFPDAAVKIFLTASVETRAKRRFDQLEESRRLNEDRPGGRVPRRSQPPAPEFDVLLRGLEARDKRDRERTASPTVPAPDALIVDTTTMTIDQAIAAVMARVQEHA